MDGRAAKIGLERGLVELELDRDRIFAAEARRAEVVRRATGRADEPLQREVAERIRSDMRADLLDSLQFGTLWVAEAGGAIVGVAAWLPPSGYPISTGRQLRQLTVLAPTLPWAYGAAIEGRRGRATVRSDHRSKPPHWFLRALGVHPNSQRSGVGADLVAPALALADEAEMGCYLTTAAEENVGWYRRVGFEATATLRPTASWPQVWSLWRDPRTPTMSTESDPRLTR